MCQSNSCASVGQELDLSPYHVVLLDASGKEHGFIGYWFYAAGAQAAANGWNAQADRTLTAVIRDGLPPKPEGPEQKYVVAAMHEGGKVALLQGVYHDKSAAERVAGEWQTDTTRAVVVDPCQLHDFPITILPLNAEPKHYEADYEHAEALVASSSDSNALDESDDSDAEDDSENAADDELEGSDSFDDTTNIKQLLYLIVDSAQMAADAGDVSYMATLGVRYTLIRYLQSVIAVVADNKIRCAADVGMIAAGLECFAVQMIGGGEPQHLHDAECDEFNMGRVGDYSNNYGTKQALMSWLRANQAEAVA